jgi:hypothetical protein
MMWCYIFLIERFAAVARYLCVLGHELFHRITAESTTADAGEEWICWKSITFAKPCLECGGGILA